jgi:outer membrane protein assembly factor BamB
MEGDMRRTGKWWMPTAAAIIVLVAVLAFWLSCGGSKSTISTGTSPSSPTAPSSPSSPSGVDVVTYHDDVARTGENTNETSLTPSNVNSTKFGRVAFLSADGKVDAEPLYLSQISMSSQEMRNVLYVVTENDTVYAFDADTGTTLWQKTMLAGSETPSEAVNGCSQVTPQIGITSTPVIDRAHNVIYVVAMSKSGTSTYIQRLHALDLTTGNELTGSPVTIQASFPGSGDNSSGGNVIFDPKQYEERAALLLLNGNVYTTWTSHCDDRPYTGWIIAYNASTLAQSQVLNVTPNGNEGSIWMSGAGPAADSAGNIYFLQANGTFDTTLNTSGFPNQGDFGNSFMKLSTSSGLSVADYFTMSNTVAESDADQDLGSGGALVLPDIMDSGGSVHHLAVGAGKDQIIYVVNRDSMGKFTPSANNIYQEIQGQLSGQVFSMPAYFNNTVYYGAVGDAIKAFSISNAKLATSPGSKSATAFPFPGATPSISANGTGSGIVWAVENASTAVLHAYDATNLANELYNSNQAAAGRDHFGTGNKFITPMIVNGKVYVGTTNGVAVFGPIS